MRKIILTSLIAAILFSTAYSQDRKIDSLIKLLNNKHFFFDMSNAGYVISLLDDRAIELEKVGKPAVQKLVEVLNDSTRGVTAHFILGSIWKRGAGFPEDVFYIDKFKCVGFKFDGLLFFVDSSGVFANKGDLEDNKESWTRYIKQNTP